MAKSKSPTLAAAEYVIPDEEGQNDQVLGARWQFVKALSHVLPEFFEQLRDQVYPVYARLAAGKRDYWLTGWKFETWQLHSDRHRQLTPCLMAWARKYNVQGENWILEGALQTLSNWSGSPKSRRRKDLDIWGFRYSIAVPGLIPDDAHRFRFEDWGWDPTFSSCSVWRRDVGRRFQAALDAYERRMRKLAKDVGAVQVASRFTTDHFEWLALYQCGDLSLDSILHRAPHAGVKTTISKGLHNAAKLAAITVRPKRSKLKKP